ncbi:hypothetical protein ACFQ1I_18940 [Kitasatospora arboriphila]
MPSPGFHGTGVRTDACDGTTAPGWIATTAPPSPPAPPPTGHASRSGTRRAARSSTPRAPPSTAPPPHGPPPHRGPYLHLAGQGRRGGAPTAECHFRIDATAPALTVDSADFPASDSGRTPQKYASQSGTFTVAGSDAASGVACYRYVLNGTPSVGNDCTGAVRPAADGTATLTLKPTDWGTNILTVQAFDEAGNASRPVAYTFYAPSNPNPPQSVPGDVNADGVPDILLPDADGNLQVLGADSANTDPASTTAASYGPGGTWAAPPPRTAAGTPATRPPTTCSSTSPAAPRCTSTATSTRAPSSAPPSCSPGPPPAPRPAAPPTGPPPISWSPSAPSAPASRARWSPSRTATSGCSRPPPSGPATPPSSASPPPAPGPGTT